LLSRRAVRQAGLGATALLATPFAAFSAPSGFDAWREHFRRARARQGNLEATWNR